ncbi:MAG: NADH-quinone oxidoreductase subunit NuoE [Candidatus Aminicenantes bacterium]|nr:NADH-quinone oxidoreductase subunit NuoE [Candidatus Aminicenantes bacterium]HHF52289.1 NADH-quinone oxidoreductase subunit NuoE [Candidatus Aminicenantes bacterium]
MKDAINEDKLSGIIEKYKDNPNATVAILQDIQEEYNYLPREAMTKVSKEFNIPLSRLLSVATFYSAFSLTPKGKHQINICLGTACHVRGGARIMNKVERELGIKRGETTEDLRFSLDEVRCLGCCGLAPVMVVGEDVHGKLSEDKVMSILEKYK